MPATQTDPRLARLLRALCEDALYVTLGRIDDVESSLATVARRRDAAWSAIARGEGQLPAAPTPTNTPLLARPLTMQSGDEWALALARACAATGAAWFLPLQSAIADGLSLDAEPKGIRAVLPIGQKAAQAKHQAIGTFAVRALHGVCAADGTPGDDERLALDSLLSALALPDDVARVLRAEPPPNLQTLELPTDLDPKLARQLAEGALIAASADGLEEAERLAWWALGTRLSLDDKTLEELVANVAKARDAQAQDGRAAIDAIRYVLAPVDAAEASSLVRACVRLAIPPLHRADVLRTLDTGSSTPLAQAHQVDRDARAMALAAAWAAALAFDPRHTMRAVQSARHDRVARDLGSERAGEEARAQVERYVAAGLDRGCEVVGL